MAAFSWKETDVQRLCQSCRSCKIIFAGGYDVNKMMTMFLVEQDHPSMHGNGTPVQYGSLGCVPVPSQENALVQDLLFCFVGIPGVHLK